MSSHERALVEALLDGDGPGWRSAFTALGDERASMIQMGALANACFKQFPENPSVEEVATYVKWLIGRQPVDSGIKTVPTELVIRSVLGEPEVLDGVPVEDLIRAQIVIINTVAQDHHLVGEAREEFVAEILGALD